MYLVYTKIEKTMSSNSSFPLRALSAAVALVACGTAGAQISDTIHPFVALGYTYDDNLLRLPADIPAEKRSDRARQAQAGITVDRPIGRQRLTGSAKVSRVTFDHFDQLDYNGKDFRGDLAWEVGNHLSGNLGGSFEQTLTPFTDYHTSERNLRKHRSEYVNGAWRFHPSWRLRGGVTKHRYEYELTPQRVNDRTEKLSEVGVDYLAKTGSRIGLVARRWDGNYENPFRADGTRIQDDYHQDELKANLWWQVSAITQVQVLAGYARRKHESHIGRDSSGPNGRVIVRWAPTGKLKFTAEGWRDFAAVESSIVSNSLNTGGSVAATWDISAKVQASASLRQQTRDFQQTNTVIFTGDPSDRTRSASLGLVYAPMTSIQLGLSAFRDMRDGSALARTGDYEANGVSFNASVQF